MPASVFCSVRTSRPAMLKMRTVHCSGMLTNRTTRLNCVISYADLRKAYRQSTQLGSATNEREIAEVTELIAISAGSLWKSLGELMRPDRRR